MDEQRAMLEMQEILRAVDQAGLMLWRLNQDLGVYSGATLSFSIRIDGKPWPLKLGLDEEGDVVWIWEEEMRVVVRADGTPARRA
jgi:hypothetical protein